MFGIDIQPLIMRHGYAAVFLVVMLEGAGSPLPGESALVLAAVYAGATGHLNIAIVIAIGAVAAILGGSCGFWIGRSLGASFVERYGTYLGLTPSRLALGRYLFEHHGGKIVFFGRFVAVLRVLAALVAGADQYELRFLFHFQRRRRHKLGAGHGLLRLFLRRCDASRQRSARGHRFHRSDWRSVWLLAVVPAAREENGSKNDCCRARRAKARARTRPRFVNRNRPALYAFAQG